MSATGIAAALRAAAEGRREYAQSGPPAITDMLNAEADAFTAAAAFVESGDRTELLRSAVPSWRWRELGVDLK